MRMVILAENGHLHQHHSISRNISNYCGFMNQYNKIFTSRPINPGICVALSGLRVWS